MLKKIIIFLISGILSGCATTNSGKGASIQYLLPKTDLTATLSMILEECPKQDGSGLKVIPTFSFTAKPGVTDKAYMVSGNELSSFRASKALTITVDANGVLSGVNSTVDDKTPEIITSTVTAITNITLPVSTSIIFDTKKNPEDEIKSPGNRLQCNKKTIETIQRVNQLRNKIDELRDKMVIPDNTTRKSHLLEDINTLAFEVARLRTGPLTQTVTKKIDLGSKTPSSSSDINFNFNKLQKNWFDVPKNPNLSVTPDQTSNLQLTNGEMKYLFGIKWFGKRLETNNGLKGTLKAKKSKECSLSIVVPAQVRGEISAVIYGNAIPITSSSTKQKFQIPQWESSDKLCLSSRFAESRTVNVSFNSYGQRQHLQWSSAARGEALADALSQGTNDFNNLRSGISGPSKLERQQEEITRVNTQLQYNAARLCDEALQAGATACPN